jgi:hypothetical protein
VGPLQYEIGSLKQDPGGLQWDSRSVKRDPVASTPSQAGQDRGVPSREGRPRPRQAPLSIKSYHAPVVDDRRDFFRDLASKLLRNRLLRAVIAVGPLYALELESPHLRLGTFGLNPSRFQALPHHFPTFRVGGLYKLNLTRETRAVNQHQAAHSNILRTKELYGLVQL